MELREQLGDIDVYLFDQLLKGRLTAGILAGEAMLRSAVARLGGAWLDPLKTTLVENLRSMTTWVLSKPPT